MTNSYAHSRLSISVVCTLLLLYQRNNIRVPNTNETRTLKLSVRRESGDTYLYFEVPQVLSQIFSAKSEEVRESDAWEGLKFYFVPSITGNADYKRMAKDYGLKDNFGHELVDKDGLFNIAFLRCEGGGGRIKVNTDLSLATIADKVRSIMRFVKDFYETFQGDYAVNGAVEFDI